MKSVPDYLLVSHSAIDYLAVEPDAERFESFDIREASREMLLSSYEFEARPGGVAANAAPILAENNKTTVHTVLGDLSPCDKYVEAVGRFGVDFSLARIVPGERMSECFIVSCGDRQKIRWFDNAAARFNEFLAPSDVLSRYEILFLSIMDPSVALSASSSYSGRLIYNAGQYIGRIPFRDVHFAEIAPKAEIIALNEAEEEIVIEAMGLESARGLFDFERVQAVIVTRSRFGSAVHTRNATHVFYPRGHVKAIDPTGAGDAFLAIFCDLYFRGADIGLAQRKASEAAEKVIQKIGSTLRDVSFAIR